MRKLAGGALAVVAGVTVACSAFGRATFREPVLTLRDAQITGLGITGGSIDINVDVYNPNNFRLDGTRLTYSVLIDSVPFGTGALDSKFTVEQGDTTRVKLPLTFTYAGVGAAGRALLQTGTVNYRVTGDITVATPLGQFTRPYEGRGRLTTGGAINREP